MRKGFFPKLAADNLKKNSRNYLPYLLSCIGTVAMFYIMFLLSKDEGIASMRGARNVQMILSMGTGVVGIFAVVFLFYTNSFLIKNRKKEFGLFQVLGMEKRHLAVVMLLETLYCAVISIGIGLGVGMLFSKLLYLILLRMLRGTAAFGFSVSLPGIGSTVLLFAGIFLVLYLNTLRQIQVSNPIELLRGGQTGEKEPKTKLFAAVLGFVLLGIGYYIAITTESPLQALPMFFVAVIAVAAGTYLLFGAGSIFLLKMLRRNEHYYYQPQHFISVSGMIYRMKQNAAGLASICVLSTAVLILVSVSASLYLGNEEAIRIRYPRHVVVHAKAASGEESARIEAQVEALAEEQGASVENVMQYRYLSVTVSQEGNTFYGWSEEDYSSSIMNLYLMTLADYNGMIGSDASLAEDEVLLYVQNGKIEGDTLAFGSKEWKIKERLAEMAVPRTQMAQLFHTAYLVFPDEASLVETVQAVGDLTAEEIDGEFTYWYGFDTDAGEAGQQELCTAIQEAVFAEDAAVSGYVEEVASGRDGMYAMYGGFLFLGIFLGLLFLMATVMIIYYKQVSEGYDDQARFQIMQKVGLSRDEVKKTIRSQIMTMFFLPLGMAGVHMIAAFPLLSRLMTLLGLLNRKLLAGGCLGTFAVFVVLYVLVYRITAKTYYKIVRWEA
ncbi:MAG: ABC transporter permease [Eubacteriales bacterium]|nr:ABC transporter permease [Eubacteriales bacterium]